MPPLPLPDRTVQFRVEHGFHADAEEELLGPYALEGRRGELLGDMAEVLERRQLEGVALGFGVPPPPRLGRGGVVDEGHAARVGEADGASWGRGGGVRCHGAASAGTFHRWGG